jgi:hypothetical protein
MLNCEDRTERERRELIEAMAEGITFVKDSTDRIANIWALRKIAEGVARLDELDQLEGFLPPQVRPPLMIRHVEADLALQALKGSKGGKSLGVSKDRVLLVKKLNAYVNLERNHR